MADDTENDNIEWWDYDTPDTFAEALAGDIGFLIGRALDARGDAILALPGDDSAFPVLDQLAGLAIRWKNVTIVPTDDLIVDVSDPRSRVWALASRFLPLGARVIPLAGGDLDAEASGRAADARLRDVHWPLDLAWLPVGADGTLAALYPGDGLGKAFQPGLRAVAAGNTNANTRCVSLSGDALVTARSLLLSARGDENRAWINDALRSGRASRTAFGRLMAAADQAVDIHWCP